LSQKTRLKNYERLVTEFEPCIFDDPSPGVPRYAAFMEEFFDEQRVAVKITLCETEQQAFEVLGASVLDGYAPDGVYDLDAAAKIDIEVSTPIVTRAEVQGESTNWLAD
jgi:hypothetical protein